MQKRWFGLGLVGLVSAGCQDPECPPDKRMVGSTCRDLPEIHEEEEPEPDGGVAPEDGSTADGSPWGPAHECEEGSGAPEECDAPDDACEGVHGLACQPGEAQVVCTTSCGTRGTGQCTDACQAPGPEACTPPAEVCNWIDDDCDGAIDPGMLTQQSANPDVVTQTGTAPSYLVQVALVPRPGGGAWLLYKAVDARAIRYQLLDENGQASGNSTELVADDALSFRAVTVGSNVIVASTHGAGNSSYLELRLLRGSDLAALDDYRLPGLTGDCANHALIDIAAYESDAGDIRIALVQARGTGTGEPNTCFTTVTGKTEFVLLTRHAGGSWSAPVTAKSYGNASFLGGSPSRVARVPCHEDWLLFRASSSDPNKPTSTWTASRYGVTGAEVSDAVGSIERTGIVDVVQQGACGEQDAPELLIVASSLEVSAQEIESSAAYVHSWRFDPSTGALLAPSAPQRITGSSQVHGSVLLHGNRLLVFGIDPFAGTSMFEHAPDAAAASDIAFKEVVEPTAPGTHALTALIGSGTGTRLTAIADAGNAIVVATGRYPNTTALDAHRDPGDTAPAVAATYAFTCGN